MTRRTAKVDAVLQAAAGEYLSQHGDLPADVFCTITRVATTPDLRHAIIYVTVLPEQARGTTLTVLRRLTPAFNKNLFHTLTTKIVPSVRFAIDDVETEAAAMEALLDAVAKDLPPLSDTPHDV